MVEIAFSLSGSLATAVDTVERSCGAKPKDSKSY